MITRFSMPGAVTTTARAAPADQTAFLSSYTPRQCGIATFTHDLRSAMDALSHRPSTVIAINDRAEPYAYGPEVTLEIERNDRRTYARAGRAVALLPIERIHVQHEYGMFGGTHGDFLMDFYDAVRQPVITTMHSVLPKPPPALRMLTRSLASRSLHVVVLASASVDILVKDYGIPSRNIEVIPHGIPTVLQPNERRDAAKACHGMADRIVLSTVGPIGPNMGLEHALEALPQIVAAHPQVVYRIIGQTHTGAPEGDGGAYRERLKAMVAGLGLEKHVSFVDSDLAPMELIEFLVATDVYVVPCQSPDHIVSGTLACAMGCGRAVVSTPFEYAREVLAHGAGVLVPFRDSAAMGRAISTLLSDPVAKATLEQNAYSTSRPWQWMEIARQYQQLTRHTMNHAMPAAVAF